MSDPQLEEKTEEKRNVFIFVLLIANGELPMANGY